MPRWAKVLAAIAVAGALGGVLVAWSGVVNIGASTGHWAVTDWALHWAMRQSVETHAMGIEPPPLDDAGLVRRGAGHYATGCAPCHGAPGLDRSAVAQGMTPEPPYLPETVPTWEAAELFWIVRHGVKFTGMPAWPALQREDEVWAVVAFLRRLPEMAPADYEALAYGPAEPPQSIAAQAAQDSAETTPTAAGCLRCHGENGAGGTAFPRLAGQSEDYLFASLQAFAEGRRHSGFMQAATAGLDEAALRRLARHYAEAEVREEAAPSTGVGDAERGSRIAFRGEPAAGVPACISCHDLEEGPRFPHYPRLAGQQAWYLAQQLRLFKAGERGGTPFAHIMRAVAQRLDAQQIDDVAAFYAGLSAGRRAAAD